MRGKVTVTRGSHSTAGITPAYAGKSYHFSPIACRSRDHPRLCGEKEFLKEVQHDELGSPPPMRGKVFALLFVLSIIGITPAYAGKSMVVTLYHNRW